ncbi:hypothetical protein A0H81_13271 [Grifola frondosa]|uniref:Uncharacterized protein n=1 Tax=Grifola frondosa TaxID=5627 RepID=A0A1C7LSN2_GRIFR|nr:hypothetical protein A0H81_13271 [Grifola frondosa]
MERDLRDDSFHLTFSIRPTSIHHAADQDSTSKPDSLLAEMFVRKAVTAALQKNVSMYMTPGGKVVFNTEKNCPYISRTSPEQQSQAFVTYCVPNTVRNKASAFPGQKRRSTGCGNRSEFGTSTPPAGSCWKNRCVRLRLQIAALFQTRTMPP